MATVNRRKKITKYRRPLNINVGMIIFGIILVYIIISIILYIRSDHVSIYQVNEGSLTVDNSYTGFILREEELGYSQNAGYINYYAREGEKAGVGSMIYTIDESGKIETILSENANGENTLPQEDLNEIKSEISVFKNNFEHINFNSVYDFKYSLEGRVLQLVNLNLLSNVDSLTTDENNTAFFNMISSPKSGIVLYYMDGYEDTTIDSFSSHMMNQSEYKKDTFTSNSLVGVDDPIYKMVTSEDWTLIIELSEERALELEEKEYLEVEFVRDNTSAWAKFSTFRKEGKIFGKLDFNNSMIRYTSDRYLEVKLLVDVPSGLKIPVSSTISKDFYTIPTNYFTKGGDNNEMGVLIEIYDENGTATSQFQPTTIYNYDEEFYYVDSNDFSLGDYIIKPDSTDRYQIGSKKPLIGVYNINKGYAVFKLIDILYENNEYCIVKKNTSYGLSVFDHIVLDSRTVEENDIVFH